MIHVDPFAYITLASLCKALFIANDLPEHSIVGNENNKTSSQVAREWLLYLQNTLSISINEEQPIFVEYVKSTRTLTCKVMRKVLTAIVPDNLEFKHYFTPPKNNMKKNNALMFIYPLMGSAITRIQYTNLMGVIFMDAPAVM